MYDDEGAARYIRKQYIHRQGASTVSFSVSFMLFPACNIVTWLVYAKMEHSKTDNGIYGMCVAHGLKDQRCYCMRMALNRSGDAGIL